MLLVESLDKCLSNLLLYIPRNVSTGSRGNYFKSILEEVPYNSHSGIYCFAFPLPVHRGSNFSTHSTPVALL